ncbi:MAG: cupredoxin domain-containing protein [Thermoplasmata archaeon]
MGRAVGFVLAVALTLLAVGTIPTMSHGSRVAVGPSTEDCGCPLIQSVRVTPAQTIGPQVNFTLAGHATRGWGFSNATISNPGPDITVYLGDVVTLTLIANDSLPHNWFIDYNNDSQPNPGEPSSPDFNVPGRTVVVWNFTADRPGQYQYRCRFHPGSMVGTIMILGEERRPGGGPGVGLIPGILLITLGGVLGFAAIYHVRAVRAAKRGK